MIFCYNLYCKTLYRHTWCSFKMSLSDVIVPVQQDVPPESISSIGEEDIPGTRTKRPRTDDDQLPERTAKRRRQFEPQDKLIEPYKWRPSISTFNYRQYMLDPPVNIRAVERMNQIWMILCFLRKDTPMWRGWISLAHTDELPQQVIGEYRTAPDPTGCCSRNTS